MKAVQALRAVVPAGLFRFWVFVSAILAGEAFVYGYEILHSVLVFVALTFSVKFGIIIGSHYKK